MMWEPVRRTFAFLGFQWDCGQMRSHTDHPPGERKKWVDDGGRLGRQD